ncbi:sulfatase family protein [Planctomicrobium sp. SH668]|uniref:sulfatase family protein n=1 Tax=Planctomicrobium sp. SH668 TaxID=3448126 RepID=UPI003F5BB7B2
MIDRVLIACAMVLLGGTPLLADSRPNIVWIVVDDMSPNFSCYGEKTIQTPHLDQLVSEGVLFERAFVTAPVCSACRSALITGMYQTSIGAHNHRSGRGERKIHLPEGVEPVPAIFQRAGYYTSIGNLQNANNGLGKTDYNFEWDRSIYDGNDWSERKPGQPFFAQIQLQGGKLREGDGWLKNRRPTLGELTSPEAVTLPPYYPRDSVLLEDWAAYLDAVRFTDRQVGEVVARLKAEGIFDQTIIFFLTDHGISHARSKQFLYDAGTHVALVACGPGVPAGHRSTQLVEQIDLAPTSLRLAGIDVSPTIQGRDLFDESAPRLEVYSARDRCDETVDRIRSVRTKDFKYIRNSYPHRPLLQPNRYKDNKKILNALRRLYQAGELTELQASILFSPERAAEELYDLRSDPDELKNLAGDPAFQDVLAQLRQKLEDWEVATNDLGREAESSEVYDLEMKSFMGNGQGEQRNRLLDNIDQMKKWASEGK